MYLSNERIVSGNWTTQISRIVIKSAQKRAVKSWLDTSRVYEMIHLYRKKNCLIKRPEDWFCDSICNRKGSDPTETNKNGVYANFYQENFETLLPLVSPHQDEQCNEVVGAISSFSYQSRY